MNIDEYRIGDLLICVFDTNVHPTEQEGKPVFGKDMFRTKKFNFGETAVVVGWVKDDTIDKKHPRLYLLVGNIERSQRVYLFHKYDRYIVTNPKDWRLAMRLKDRAVDNEKANLYPYL